MLRIAGLPVFGPTDVISGARAVLGWGEDAVGLVAELPERIGTLLDEVDVLVRRVTAAVDRIDGVVDEAAVLVSRIDPLLADVRTVADSAAGLVAKAGGVTDEASGVVAGAAAVTGRADAVIVEASGASRTATELLALYQPLATRAAPLAQRFVDELSEHEVEAAIRLVDQVPQFTEHMETDIMPILATLDRVGPDVHELLDVLKDVRMAIQGVPGFKLLRRRGEREEEEKG